VTETVPQPSEAEAAPQNNNLCRCESYARVTERAALAGARWLGRANDESTRNPVQLDQRQCRDKLILGCDENRPARELRETTAKTRAAQKIAQRNAGGGTPQEAAQTV